eukprot:TRINITY_DN2418_c0_g1_i1.p1 TRINITY_DN2418_c0_g1~~TRINITY_DN2418_c0_g1_i1.p1  ORF type:complete len:200 (-),score=38.01 TRINITY_DN2418_c0_g1_i1:126-725(-)
MQGPVAGFAKIYGKSPEIHIDKKITQIPVWLGRSKSRDKDPRIEISENKSVSRKHARIGFNAETGNYELTVHAVGTNTVMVNGKCYSTNDVVVLNDRSAIVICDAKFYFLLPERRNGMNHINAINSYFNEVGSHSADSKSIATWISINFAQLAGNDEMVLHMVRTELANPKNFEKLGDEEQEIKYAPLKNQCADYLLEY